jgi:hypothetical protein
VALSLYDRDVDEEFLNAIFSYYHIEKEVETLKNEDEVNEFFLSVANKNL